MHAVDLAHLRVADSAVVLGAGPIGLLIVQLARLSGCDPVFVSDRLPWRLKLAEKFGGTPVNFDQADPVREVMRATGGRGVDVAFEAAWADHSVQQAAEMVRLGGRVMLVGIPASDRIEMKASTARRKGLTVRLARRMKHTYPRALRLLLSGAVDLKALISHRFPLAQTPTAFALNNAYADNVVKVIVDVP